MAEAIDIHGTAFKSGSVILLARIVGQNGADIVRSDLSAITYSVFLLDDRNADSRTAVDGHSNASLTVTDVVFNTPVVDALWTADEIGYNFRHVLDVSVHPAFVIAGRRYLVEYQLRPTVGQRIVVRFRINVL
jgi:hypothetical protein